MDFMYSKRTYVTGDLTVWKMDQDMLSIYIWCSFTDSQAIFHWKRQYAWFGKRYTYISYTVTDSSYALISMKA